MNQFLHYKTYITLEGQNAIKNFKYKGGSSSWSYQYIFSPFAQYLLQYVPLNWAPNSITLAGFLLVVLAEIIIYSFGTLGDQISAVRLISFSICIFVYTTLDNIDGKQSRRTKTSSPLGMLFDHGCDSLSCLLIGSSMSRIIGVQNQKLLLFVLFLGVMLTFFMSVWTQYHSQGVMLLGKINGVDDGLPLIYLIAFFTAFVGVQFWNQQSIFNIPRKYLFIYCIFVGAFLQILSLFFNSSQTFTKDVKGALKQLIHIVCITFSLFIITTYTDWYKIQNYYNVILFSLGFMFVRDITYLQLCVVTQQSYNQFTSSNIVFIIGYPLYIFIHKSLKINIISQWIFIYGMLIFFIVNYFHFVLSIINHIAEILNIRVFSIKKTGIESMNETTLDIPLMTYKKTSLL